MQVRELAKVVCLLLIFLRFSATALLQSPELGMPDRNFQDVEAGVVTDWTTPFGFTAWSAVPVAVPVLWSDLNVDVLQHVANWFHRRSSFPGRSSLRPVAAQFCKMR